jgi:hypothetical protein
MSAGKDILLHIPHSSTEIPVQWRSGITLDDDALARELLSAAISGTPDVLPSARNGSPLRKSQPFDPIAVIQQGRGRWSDKSNSPPRGNCSPRA